MADRHRHLFALTIVEGPDGCGKSYLADRLVKANIAQAVAHHGAYLDDGPEIVNRYLTAMRYPPKAVSHLVFDRSWLSEPIYGWVKRHGHDRVGVAGRRYCERLALACQGVVLLPATDFETCAVRYMARQPQEYLTDLKELREVYNLYSALGTMSSLPTFIVNLDSDPQDIMAVVHRSRPLANLGPGIGHWNPGRVTLLVGEQVSRSYDTDLPFIAPNNSTAGCSFWLAGQLEGWGVREAELYWVNALNRDGHELNPMFLDFLKPRKVIALGKVAERWCRETAKVSKFETVEHPQYWRRFCTHQNYPLKEAILS